MDQISNLINRAQILATRKEQSLSTISRKILNDGKGITRLQNGGQCTLRTLGKALKILESLENECAAHQRIVKKPNIVNRGLSYLERLEAESIHIFRETVAECKNPVLLYSAGKDSAVMLHLAMKAFYPARPPFPLLHVDTGWKFKEMIAFRDRRVAELGLKLHVHINTQGQNKGINPITHGAEIHTDVMKTQGLRQALDKFGFDAAFGGGRRDEEKSRAKERIFSVRSAGHRWDPKNQRAELWDIYNTSVSNGQSLRIFPLSNWTELDVWQYIFQEKIEIPNLYFAKKRSVLERDNMLVIVDDDRLPVKRADEITEKMVRFRTLGCYPLTGAILSQATTLPDIISELLKSKQSERKGRSIDKNASSTMESKKAEGYF